MEPLAPGRTLALPIRARFVTLRGYQYCPSDWRMPYIPVGWFFAVLPLSGGGTLVLFVPVAGQAAGSALRFPQAVPAAGRRSPAVELAAAQLCGYSLSPRFVVYADQLGDAVSTLIRPLPVLLDSVLTYLGMWSSSQFMASWRLS